MLFVNFIFTNLCVFVTESDVPVTTSIMVVITTTLSSQCHMHTSRRKDPGLTITGSLPSGPSLHVSRSQPVSLPTDRLGLLSVLLLNIRQLPEKTNIVGPVIYQDPQCLLFPATSLYIYDPFLYIPGPTTSYFFTPRLKEKQEMNNLWLIVLVFLVLLFVSCLFPQPVCKWHWEVEVMESKVDSITSPSWYRTHTDRRNFRECFSCFPSWHCRVSSSTEDSLWTCSVTFFSFFLKCQKCHFCFSNFEVTWLFWWCPKLSSHRARDYSLPTTWNNLKQLETHARNLKQLETTCIDSLRELRASLRESFFLFLLMQVVSSRFKSFQVVGSV